MLPRPNRLPSFEISKLMRSGKRVSGNGVTLIYRITNYELRITECRFAFVVSTKIDKRAVVRNRMRRIMSESVRHELPAMTHGIDGIFIGSKQLIGKMQKEVAVYIHEILHETIRP